MPIGLCLLLQAAAPVLVTAEPAPIHVERAATEQRIEFDFRLVGLTDDTLHLTAVRLIARDRAGKPWSIRFVDESGADPSLLTLPRRDVPGKAAIMVYNPFSRWPADAPIAQLDYRFVFTHRGREWQVPVTVRPAASRQPVPLDLPLAGRILVFEGHDFYSHHRRVDVADPIMRQVGIGHNSERYAHDLSLVDAAGSMFRGDGRRNADWYSWGAPVFAPAAGTVVAVANSQPDYDVGNPDDRLSPDSIFARPMALAGNHVIIDHGHGYFSRLFHLRRGSVTVRPGQRVAAGQRIGAIGFSGSVYTIHLHYEAAAGAGLDVDGLPSSFRNFRRVWGARVVPARGPIDTGEIVER